jgi:phosphoglycerate dehydrogenase-like enzyme
MGYPIVGHQRVLLIAELDNTVRGSLARLAHAGLELEYREDLAGTVDVAALGAALDGVWAVIAGNERYDRSVFSRATSLRVIARPGAGHDGVDMEAADEAGVAVFVTPAANTEAVADFTVGLMLASLRRVVALDALIRQQGWREHGLATDLHHSTIGIVGLGAIGRAVARRLIGFECRILAAEPNPDRDFCNRFGIRVVELEQLLTEALVVTLHVPLSATTEHLISRRALSLARSDAVLVNTSRGRVVDEVALVAALREGRIAGAALDVYETEPIPATSPLRTMPNVVLTSHAAAHTESSMRNMLDGAITGVLAAARGEVPDNCLNPSVVAAWTDPS